MQLNHALIALVGMMATGALASPVPEANPDAEPEALEARAEQAKQHYGSPCGWRGCYSDRFDNVDFYQDNDFLDLDILKRDESGLQARAEQAEQAEQVKQGEQHYWPDDNYRPYRPYRPNRFPVNPYPYNRYRNRGYRPYRPYRQQWDPNWQY